MPNLESPSNKPIDTYVINLVKRPDRRADSIREFSSKPEFNMTVVDAVEEAWGAMGLWKTIRSIIQRASDKNSDFIIFCEDDHKFTRGYSEKKLRENIEKARALDSDVLLGGVSWSGDSVRIDKTLFWTKSFSGLQFTVIFNKFFDTIINADLRGYDAADYYICRLSDKIFMMHPFISIQRPYPYSDATPRNAAPGRIKSLFINSEYKLKQHRKVSKYFDDPKRQKLASENTVSFDTSGLVIPTYIINLKKRPDRKAHILDQFRTRQEFQYQICNGVEHEKGQIGLWESIKKVIRKAKRNKDDVILICEDDHLFTRDYDKDAFIKNIVKGHTLHADVLLGGICNFSTSVKATENLFWVSDFYCTQFMVVYERFFDAILKSKYNDNMTVDGQISAISANKLVLYPFVSVQKDFGYSDITIRNSTEIKSALPFTLTMKRFELINDKQRSIKQLSR